METKISMKTIYLILVITIGLIGLGVGSTFAVFTASAEINSPIYFSTSLTYDSDIYESIDVVVGANSTRDINFAIYNDDSIANVNYAVWYTYSGNSNDLTFGVNYSEQNCSTPSGVLDLNGYNVLISVTNNTSSNITFTIGVSTSKDDIVLPSYMNIVPNNIIYYVFYNANSGDSSTLPSRQIKRKGVSLTLSDVVPKREGYTFEGWNNINAGTGTTYQPGATYTVDDDVILFAQWKKVNKYTVTYNANNGSNAPSSQIKTEDVPLTLTTAIPTRSGFEFVGWNTQADGNGTSYQPGSTYTANANITLYAKWVQIFTISYNANGGSNAPSAQTKKYGETLTLSSQKPKRTGYTFNGWYLNSGGTGTSYQPGSKYTANANATLYAKWTANKIYINYYTNGGSLTQDSINRGYYVDSNGLIHKNGVNYITTLNYGDSLTSDGLIDYNSSNNLEIVKSGYSAPSGKEWIDKNSAKTYSQSYVYSYSDFCDASNGNCTTSLIVKWSVGSDTINDYRCINNSFYYITNCVGQTCYYNNKYCRVESGVVTRSSLQYCSNESIDGDACTRTGYKYHLSTCRANVCNYTQLNGSTATGTVNRCDVIKVSCGSHTKSMYVTSSNGLNCRKSPNTSSDVVVSIPKCTKLEVGLDEVSSGWYYMPTVTLSNGYGGYNTYNSCYLSADSLSTTSNCG